MNDFRSLKFLDLFRSLFTALQIDYPALRKILAVKLTMDQRRVPTIFSQNMSKKKDKGNQFIKSLWIYALYGIALVPFIFLGENYLFQISIMFGIMMFILMTSMISDFSSVLLDVRDKAILNTKPIDGRTVNTAKIIHVTIYMAMLTGAFIAIPSVVMLFVQGIGYFLLFLVEVVLLVLLIMSITALVYIFILKYFSGEKLKDIINYVQILLSVGIIVGYQIVARSFEFIDAEFTFDFSWWHVFIPPIWFGGSFELLLHHTYTFSIVLLSILALVMPFISIYLYYRLMPAFERNLEKLLEETGKGKKKRRRIRNFWTRIVCWSKEERLFFRFASIMMSQERDFKLRVYPTLGMALLFPLVFLFNEVSMSGFRELAEGQSYFTIYFSNIVIGIVVYMLQFSGKYKGAWIFETTPIEHVSSMYSATLKAFLVKLYLPIFILLTIIYVTLFSVRIVPDLAVVLVTAILHTLISYKIVNNEDYPFSNTFETAQQGASSVKSFLLMIFVGGFVILHYVASLVDYGVYVYLIILLVVTIAGWKIVFRGRKKFEGGRG